MPSSLIIAALVVAWLVILVPMIARKRQEVTKTADSALAARVVRSGSANAEMRKELDMSDEPAAAQGTPENDHRDYGTEMIGPREFRPGRGGFDAQAAAETARAKYAFRQRVVIAVAVLAIATGVAAGLAFHPLWWVHAACDAILVGYLIYLRRQVRIEREIRQRRSARAMRTTEDTAAQETVPLAAEDVPAQRTPPRPARTVRPAIPGATVLDVDDANADFAHLDSAPTSQPYGRAVGE